MRCPNSIPLVSLVSLVSLAPLAPILPSSHSNPSTNAAVAPVAHLHRQKQFTDLGGEAAAQGDLKSVVLHAVEARSVQSSFPIALGARITGVEEKFYSSVGAPFSMIVLPNQKGMAPVKLQEEDVSVGMLVRSQPLPPSHPTPLLSSTSHTDTHTH